MMIKLTFNKWAKRCTRTALSSARSTQLFSAFAPSQQKSGQNENFHLSKNDTRSSSMSTTSFRRFGPSGCSSFAEYNAQLHHIKCQIKEWDRGIFASGRTD
jgi:hypothetical protein